MLPSGNERFQFGLPSPKALFFPIARPTIPTSQAVNIRISEKAERLTYCAKVHLIFHTRAQTLILESKKGVNDAKCGE
jgi:hypothetical protein